MYDPSVISLAASYSPDGTTSTISLEKTTIHTPKTQYLKPSRLVGTKKQLFGDSMVNKVVGLLSRKLFG